MWMKNETRVKLHLVKNIDVNLVRQTNFTSLPKLSSDKTIYFRYRLFSLENKFKQNQFCRIMETPSHAIGKLPYKIKGNCQPKKLY